jgi:acetylornithine deacetylase/succinyl-diaminopimelate desuccinylase-like protein
MIDAAKYIERNLDRYVAELSEFASIPSVSSQSTGIAEAAQWLARALERRGVKTQILPTAGNPVVVGRIGSGARTVLLYNHYDVQPPEPIDAWTTPPFEPALRDGKLYARGVMDDKGEIVARLAALDVLRERYGNDLPLALTFFVEGEEENGSRNLEPFILEHRELLAADACIWEAGQVDGEGRPYLWLGLRGLLYVELVAHTLRHDAHSGWAHVLPNAAWRLIDALTTLRDRDGNVTIEGFGAELTGPTPRQYELLRDMPDEAATYRAEYGVQQFVGGREGLAQREAVFAPTCNISGIWAGHIEHGNKTVIPGTAHARIDFRLAPDQHPEHCLRALREHLERHGFGDIEVLAREGELAACSDPDHPFIELTVDVLREHYGCDPLVTPMVGGTGPASQVVRHLGVPFASIGCSYPGSRKHAPDENVRLSDFVRGAGAIADLLDRYSLSSSTRSMFASR